jgi:hypothetical protein
MQACFTASYTVQYRFSQQKFTSSWTLELLKAAWFLKTVDVCCHFHTDNASKPHTANAILSMFVYICSQYEEHYLVGCDTV